MPDFRATATPPSVIEYRPLYTHTNKTENKKEGENSAPLNSSAKTFPYFLKYPVIVTRVQVLGATQVQNI